MNILQENRLKMGEESSAYLHKISPDLSSVLPDLPGNISSLDDIISRIQGVQQNQEYDKTGITITKKQLKTDLISLAMDVGRKLSSYAKLNNNQTLLKEVSYSKSSLEDAPANVLKDRCQGIYEKANAHLDDLASYYITSAGLNSLLNAIVAFNAAIPTPQLGIKERKDYTAQLDKLFDEADDILEKIDAMFEIIRTMYADIYNGYRNVRKLEHFGERSLALKGIITDASTGEPLKGVTLCIEPSNGNGTLTAAALSSNGNGNTITKRTADKGGFNVKNMAAGDYTATFSKPGHKTQTVSFSVAAGEMTKLKIVMES